MRLALIHSSPWPRAHTCEYTGYEHRRTIGYDSEVSSGANEDIRKGARTYVFCRQSDVGKPDQEGDAEDAD